jgi:hypothetical protein
MKNRTKYPRSWHISYSEKMSSDDKKHSDDSHFIGKKVIVTIKMDGENTTIYNDHIHARSLNSLIDSEDRRWVDALRKSKVENNIPNSFRICGENLFYKHTCYYDDLESMFYVFSIWDNDKCLSWDETKMWCDLLDIKMVPIIYEDIYDKNIILSRFHEYLKSHINAEGFVVRLSDEFNINEFKVSLNKYVRKTFVIPDQHWKYSQKTINKLKDEQTPWTLF